MKYLEQIVITKNLLEEYGWKSLDEQMLGMARRKHSVPDDIELVIEERAPFFIATDPDGKSVAVSQVHEDEHTDYYHVAVVWDAEQESA